MKYVVIDTAPLTCQPGQFQCAGSGHCIPINWVCDGEADCGASFPGIDSSDEDPVKCKRLFPSQPDVILLFNHESIATFSSLSSSQFIPSSLLDRYLTLGSIQTNQPRHRLLNLFSLPTFFCLHYFLITMSFLLSCLILFHPFGLLLFTLLLRVVGTQHKTLIGSFLFFSIGIGICHRRVQNIKAMPIARVRRTISVAQTDLVVDLSPLSVTDRPTVPMAGMKVHFVVSTRCCHCR